MIEQTIILAFLILALGATLWLYFFKAKKQVVYKGDERWQMLQLKVNQAASISNYILLILVFLGTVIPMFTDTEIVFSLQRVTIYVEMYIGIRNLIELVAIKYLDKKI